jgi:hypothetical protein
MKEFKRSQYGWTVVTHFEQQGLYSVEKDDLTYLIPDEIWDGLDAATQRADAHRKSRDHFRESRDIEKERASTTVSNLVANHLRLTKDLHNEIDFLSLELENVEKTLRHYKAGVILLSVVAIICFCATFII